MLPEASLYKLLMSQPYSDVGKEGVWHVLRLYHRLIMAGATSEALAETVGSMLTQSNRNRAPGSPLVDTINAVRLRCFGISCGAADTEFIARCLDIHFRSKPWHFQLSSAYKSRRPNDLLGPSVAVHHHRLALYAAAKFPWANEDLRVIAAQCSRPDLRATSGQFNTETASTARAGFALASSTSRAAMRKTLAAVVVAAQPATFSRGVGELVGAGPS